MLSHVKLLLFTPFPLRSREGLERLLTPLTADERFTPDSFGEEENRQSPFDRDALIARVCTEMNDASAPVVFRRKEPGYRLIFQTRAKGISGLTFEVSGDVSGKGLELPFLLGEQLATSLEPEYGLVHPVWKFDGADRAFVHAGTARLIDYPRFGPRGICARNWFGGRLLSLVDARTLQDAGLEVKPTSWGAVTFDLVERPWEVDYETLRQRYYEVMDRLRPTGIFGDYSTPLVKKAPRWQPFNPMNP